jgi:hypothetical protein
MSLEGFGFLGDYAFPGDLVAKYLASDGGPGTYISIITSGSFIWTKQ